jgi:hypothetical protein
MGTKRQDVTPLPVRFWTVTRFTNYVIVYRPETVPLQVIAILHGKRDLEEVLQNRPSRILGSRFHQRPRSYLPPNRKVIPTTAVKGYAGVP